MTTRRVVVDHVLLVVGDLETSRRLYTAALVPLGYEELSVKEDGVHYGAEGIDDFSIYQGGPVTTAAHVAFDAPDRESVDAFFEAAIAHGATARGRPGRWDQYSDRYYAAYVLDPHGNNVEAVWHAPEPIDDAMGRVLATILSTDIVGSTERIAEIGDGAWAKLLAEHNAIVREQIDRFEGNEIDTAGDGFLISFESAARAVRCAMAVVEELRSRLDVEIRAGIHTGESEKVDGKLAGIAVHVAARIAAEAASGEVLVSQTVKDLLTGFDVAVADAGEHELKGVPGTWRVFRVHP
jgi:class 3 adenylate cyclase